MSALLVFPGYVILLGLIFIALVSFVIAVEVVLDRIAPVERQ